MITGLFFYRERSVIYNPLSFSTLYYKLALEIFFLLVIKNDVRLPNPLVRYSDDVDAVEVTRVPSQMVIGPDLRDPAVRCQELVFFLLRRRQSLFNYKTYQRPITVYNMNFSYSWKFY